MYKTSSTANGIDSAKYRIVDLRSDTLSVPPPKMVRAMFEAEVGDDVYGEDPTVKALEARSAELLGKEAALFVPSGTMGNLIAMMVHCPRRGSEAIMGSLAHTFLYEQGGSAYLAGVSTNLIENRPDGTFDLSQLRSKIRGFDVHEPRTVLVCVENTHNMCGGKVLPLEWLDELSKICREERLKLHMDGARVFSAAAYLKVPIARVVRDVDSVCFCLSKNLCCAVGSMLVGSKEFIRDAHRMRKALGGGMRQVGYLAAGGLYALENIVPRLDEDHARARRIAEGIHTLRSPNFVVELENVQTNIFMIHVVNEKVKSSELADRLKTVEEEEIKKGIVDPEGRGIVLKLSARDWSYARIVTYFQIDDELVELAIKKLQFVIREYDEKLK